MNFLSFLFSVSFNTLYKYSRTYKCSTRSILFHNFTKVETYTNWWIEYNQDFTWILWVILLNHWSIRQNPFSEWILMKWIIAKSLWLRCNEAILWIKIYSLTGFCFILWRFYEYISIKIDHFHQRYYESFLYSKSCCSLITASKMFHICASWCQSKYPLSCHNGYMMSGQLRNITMGMWHCHWYQTIMWPTAWIFYTRSQTAARGHSSQARDPWQTPHDVKVCFRAPSSKNILWCHIMSERGLVRRTSCGSVQDPGKPGSFTQDPDGIYILPQKQDLATHHKIII